jgi:hypothetical protein
VDPTRPLKVTLAWSDAPGAVSANPALVNDLDLTVTLGANTYRGNVFSAGWSAPGGSADRLNNLENVYVQNASGPATITVSATNVPGDGVPYNADLTDQDFAFVCSNCSTLSPFRIEIDDFDPGGNGVLEDGEDALLLLTWHNDDAQAVGPLTAGVASASPIQLPQPSATYGTIPAGGDGFAAYGILASGPRPAAHWDAEVNETLSTGDSKAWTVHIGPTFADVPPAARSTGRWRRSPTTASRAAARARSTVRPRRSRARRWPFSSCWPWKARPTCRRPAPRPCSATCRPPTPSAAGSRSWRAAGW